VNDWEQGLCAGMLYLEESKEDVKQEVFHHPVAVHSPQNEGCHLSGTVMNWTCLGTLEGTSWCAGTSFVSSVGFLLCLLLFVFDLYLGLYRQQQQKKKNWKSTYIIDIAW